MENRKLTDVVDKKILVDLLYSFSKVTGFMTKIVGSDGEILVDPVEDSEYCKTVRSAVECKVSNDIMTINTIKKGKADLYYCHMNIWHFAAPIIINNVHYGTIIGGQFITASPSIDRLKKHAASFNVPVASLEDRIKSLPLRSKHSALIAGEILHSIAVSIGKLCLKNQEFLSIFEAVKEFSSLDDKNDILNLILKLSMDFISADFGKVFLIGEDKKSLHLERVCDLGYIKKADMILPKWRNSAIPEEVLGGKEVIFGSIEAINKEQRSSVSSHKGSFICFPLVASGELCGVIQLESRNKREYTGYDVDILKILGAHGGMAVKNVEIQLIRENMIFLDDLTQIYNRRHLNLALAAEEKRSSRFKHKFAVMFMDVDNFKIINDRYGHKCGDAVLIGISRRIKAIIRSVNIFGRYGGEEFMLILPECGLKNAEKIAKRLIISINREPFISLGNKIHATISIGIALFPLHASNKDAIVHQADMAMYMAKSRGKNQSFTFSEDMHKKLGD